MKSELSVPPKTLNRGRYKITFWQDSSNYEPLIYHDAWNLEMLTGGLSFMTFDNKHIVISGTYLAESE